MGRIFFWVILIAALALAWMWNRRKSALTNEERDELNRLRGALQARKQDRQSGEPMQRCPVCGTFFLAKTGVPRREKLYCSAECRDKDREA